MGNYNRFEKLKMLGELDEKYIREADKYLVQPLLADGEVIRLAPERRKFSFKTFAAAAASLAVLIGGTAALSRYLSSRPITPPVTNTSDSSDDSGNSSEIDNSKDNSDNSGKTEAERLAYLEEFREKCKISDDITVAYARDRLNITEFTLPDGSFFSNETQENKYRVIDEERLLSNYNDSELRVYKINSSEYETIYRTADDNSIAAGNSTKITLKYTTRGYALFEIEVSRGSDFIFKELRLIDLNTHAMETAESYGAFHTDSYFAINGDMLYFSDELSVRSYKIHSNEPSELVTNGWNPFIYNGEACYWHDDSPDGGGSPNSARYIKDNKPLTDISAIDVLVGKDFITYYDVYEGALKDESTGKAIVTEVSRDFYNNMAFDFGVLFEYEPGRFCIYNAHANEVLVFAKDDRLFYAFPSDGHSKHSEYDGLIYVFNGSKGYIISEKPDPEAEKKQQYLDNIRTAYGVSDDVNVAYMRDRLDVIKYSLPWDSVLFAADNGRLFIDSHRAITPSEYVLDKIEMYLLDTKEYVTLISKESDPLADENTWYYVYYANKDLIVFSRRHSSNSDLCVIDLNKDGYPCTTIAQNNDISRSLGSYVTVDGNTLYFVMGVISPGSDTAHDAIYRYELGSSTEPELYVEEGIPLCVCNGDLLYITLTDDAPTFADEIYAYFDYRVIHSKSGTLPMEGEKFGFDMWACKYGIFRNEDNKLIDCFTNKVILSDISGASISLLHNQCDFGLVLGPSLGCIYDAHTNEVLVLEEGDGAHQAMQYVNCNWGFCGLEPNGYLICEK